MYVISLNCYLDYQLNLLMLNKHTAKHRYTFIYIIDLYYRFALYELRSLCYNAR